MNQTHPGGDGHRLFFALWPPDEVRTALASAADGVRAFAAARRVQAPKLHLTLHFLGGWAKRSEDIVSRASAAAAGVHARAFHLVVDRAGCFSGAHVGWLGPAGNSGLDAVWSALGHALDDACIARREQPRFTPHVTVCRGLRSPMAEMPVAPISWPVEDFVLVESHDGRYDVIGRWLLATC